MIETRPMTRAEIAARDAAICGRCLNIDEARQFPGVTAIAECMAAHMVEASASIEGNCTEADLIAKGFTPQEIARHGAAARQIAYSRIGGRA